MNQLPQNVSQSFTLLLLSRARILPVRQSFQVQHPSPLLDSASPLVRLVAHHCFLESNPAETIELPKSEERLPTSVLTIDEVEWLTNVADVTTSLGLRDRAIMERFTVAAFAAASSSRWTSTT